MRPVVSFHFSQLPLDLLSCSASQLLRFLYLLSCRPFLLLSLLAAAMAASLEQALGAAAVLRLHSGAVVEF